MQHKREIYEHLYGSAVKEVVWLKMSYWEFKKILVFLDLFMDVSLHLKM